VQSWIGFGDGTLAGFNGDTLDAMSRDVTLADLDGNRLLDTVATAMGRLELGTNTTPIRFIVGDVNLDGVVNAADIPALFDEFFDGDGSDADSCGGGTMYSNAGADLNGDHAITAADTVALVSLIAQ